MSFADNGERGARGAKRRASERTAHDDADIQVGRGRIEEVDTRAKKTDHVARAWKRGREEAERENEVSANVGSIDHTPIL